MDRLKHQITIKRLVTESEIHTQGELPTLLEKESIHTAQVTVSRSIRELNLSKVGGGQGEAYYRILNSSALRPEHKTSEERLVDIIIETGVSLIQIKFINLLTALPGGGQAIGALIDHICVHNPHILGRIAGDDTILILSENKEDAPEVNNYFQQYLYHP